MILTISQYIESLWSSEGRLRSLGRLYPVCDEGEIPLFTMPGHRLVDFEVVADGERCTLRCPLVYDGGTAAKLRTLAERDRGLESRFFTEWRQLPAEIVLFDEEGKPLEVDVLVRRTPEGEPLADFLGSAVVRGDVAAVSAVSRSFEELTEWAAKVGRSGIAVRRLLVAPDGSLHITGFSANDETGRVREMLSAAARGEKPATGTEHAWKHEEKETGYGLDGEENIRLVRDGGGWMYVDRLGKSVIDAVWTAAEPFRSGRAAVETQAGKGLIDMRGRTVLSAVYEEVVWDDHWGLASVMTEGRWSLTDREGIPLTDGFYDWLGECSEGLVLAQKGDKCGFVDVAGRETIPFIYDDASSFSEGCALVSSGGESFFINARGMRI